MSDKQHIVDTLIAHEERELADAEAARESFAANSALDPDSSFDPTALSMSSSAEGLAHSYEEAVVKHRDALARLRAIDVGPRDRVEEGAVVEVDGTKYVVAVVADEFECGGETYMGISVKAPIFVAMQGRRAGESFELGGRTKTIDAVS